MTELIVMRACTAAGPSGEKIETVVGIERPRQEGSWHWTCAINLGAIPHLSRIAVGVDSWQAAQLAMLMVHTELVAKQHGGWSFSFFEGEETTPASLLYNPTII